MEKITLILSIVASVGTIISLIISFKLKKELTLHKQQIEGNKNIQSLGDNVINNTGNDSNFKR